jgi:hypothetical protein
MATTARGLNKPKSSERHFKPFNTDPSLNVECTKLSEPAWPYAFCSLGYERP